MVNTTMTLAYILGDIPSYPVLCRECGKWVPIGDCPAGHDDICSNCAIKLFGNEDTSKQVDELQ